MGEGRLRKELAKEELTAPCARRGGVWLAEDGSRGQLSNLAPDLSTNIRDASAAVRGRAISAQKGGVMPLIEPLVGFSCRPPHLWSPPEGNLRRGEGREGSAAAGGSEHPPDGRRQRVASLACKKEVKDVSGKEKSTLG